MADFLLELFSEEIPARMQPKAAEDLKRLFGDALAEAGLAVEDIETHATPRRLALIARGLPLATADVSEERRGPRADAPPQAVEGFLKSTGLSRDQLEERDDAKGRFLYAVIARAGRPTRDVLAEVVPAIVRSFPWPKSMRWGSGSLRWVRPLHSIVALLDGEVVDLDIDGIRSGRTTRGHRFLSHGPVEIASAADYAASLRAAHVILSTAERTQIIGDRAREAAKAKGLDLIEDAGLLAENAGLTEWPVPLVGDFDPSFLDVPPEVIQLTMRVNQKYFACREPATGKLAPAFVCVANIEASDGGAAIVAGNRKVLAARLSDAKFFWEQDKKVRLEDRLPKLGEIVFHEKLGTVAEKVERVRQLAVQLVDSDLILPTDQTPPGAFYNQVQDAAWLAKADLVTAMVGEFPELQGVMGGYYALAEGLPAPVATAIRDHYKPIGQLDNVPNAPVTVAVALADKLDTLLTFFLIEERPSGSKDPFALRRAAIASARLILDNGYRIPLLRSLGRALADLEQQQQVIMSIYGNFLLNQSFAEKQVLKAAEQVEGLSSAEWVQPEDVSVHVEPRDTSKARAIVERASALFIAAGESAAPTEVLNFMIDRLKVQQREAGVRHDLIDAIFALGGEDDLVRLLARVKALQAFVATEDGTNLLAGYKRAANILRIEEKKDGASFDGAVDTLLLTQPEEQRLAAEIDAVIPDAQGAVEREDFAAAMSSLARLREPIDAFFNHVTVNDSEAEVRANRLRLLNRIRAAVHTVADFSKIEG